MVEKQQKQIRKKLEMSAIHAQLQTLHLQSCITLKNQAHSKLETSKTSQHRWDAAESAGPCPHSEAQHAPTLLFIFILCHPLLLSFGHLLMQRNAAFWVRGGPGGNTHNDPKAAKRMWRSSEFIPPGCLSVHTHTYFSVCA